MARSARGLVLVVGLLLVAGALLVVPTAAGAQEAPGCFPEDPYSGGEQCPDPPTCSLEQTVVDAGARMRVQAAGFGAGDTLTGVFDGTIVFEEFTADGSLDITFTIPERPPGEYALIVYGEPSGQECDPPLRISAEGTAVLGTQFTRGNPASGTSVGGGSTGGTRVLGRTYARTGVQIALLVLVGVLLVLAGRTVRRAARARS